MEYCHGGDLLEYLIRKGKLNERKTAFIMQKLISAIKYLHGENMCHRDLKLENVLFVNKNPNS